MKADLHCSVCVLVSEAACVVCKDSANRWTEACQLLAGWYRKKGVEFKDEDVDHTRHTHRTPLLCCHPSPPTHPSSTVGRLQLFAHVGLPKDMDTLD